MSLKCRLPELEASINPTALRTAADKYSNLLLTLYLCIKMVDPIRANVRAYASGLKKRLTTWHNYEELNAILSNWDPVGYVLGLRREANDNARATDGPVSAFV